LHSYSNDVVQNKIFVYFFGDKFDKHLGKNLSHQINLELKINKINKAFENIIIGVLFISFIYKFRYSSIVKIPYL
jgi:hypothetical protein